MTTVIGSLSLDLTVFFGLLSVVLSLILYFRSTRRKRLTFTYGLTQLQTRRHPEITILFKGKQVESLSRLRVVAWNSGNQEIRRSDIPSDGNPAIVLSGARVLSVAVSDASANTKSAVFQLDDHIVAFEFEFLNPKDYATLDILFEARELKPADVKFTARVIGGLPSDSRQFEQPQSWFDLVSVIPFLLAWCGGLFAWAQHLGKWVQRTPSGIRIVDGSSLFGSTLALVAFLLLFCVVIPEYARKYRASRLPQLARRAFGR